MDRMSDLQGMRIGLCLRFRVKQTVWDQSSADSRLRAKGLNCVQGFLYILF